MEYPIMTLDQLRPILLGLRKQAGLSQVALASLLGVSQQSYARIEANPSATSVERLFKILSLLGGDIILRERMPRADPSGLGASHIVGKGTTTAPAKLIPPSKKTERW